MYSTRMNKNMVLQDEVIGRKTPIMGYLPDPSKKLILASTDTSKQSKVNAVLKKDVTKEGRNADNFSNGLHGHVKLGQKITETVKGKLSLGARILQMGGIEKLFKRQFSVREDEKLFKAFQCYLSTTAGPIAGLLFISTHKIAFCSQRSIRITSPKGESIRVHYKVLIPLTKINRVNQSENLKKPSQKYVEIVTVDDFDFWFMGFLKYKKVFNCLQQALSQSLDQC